MEGNRIDNAGATYVNEMQCEPKWSTPHKCAMCNCQNISTLMPDITFFDFPAEAKMASIWKKKCGLQENIDSNSLKICSNHFDESDYIFSSLEQTATRSRILKPYAIPNKNVIKDRPPLSQVKQAVDQNEHLVSEHEKLLQKEKALKKKIKEYEKNIKEIDRKLPALKSGLTKVKKMARGSKKEKDLLSEVFSSNQIGVLLGRRKVVWSEDDLAMAFCLRNIGTKECYLYLKNTLNIPLPSLSCIQRWAASVETDDNK